MRLEKENKIFHIEMRLSLYSARYEQERTIIRDEIMDNFSLSYGKFQRAQQTQGLLESRGGTL